MAPSALPAVKPAEIEKKLGKGSYAVVFAARRRDDGQLYALKLRLLMQCTTVLQSRMASVLSTHHALPPAACTRSFCCLDPQRRLLPSRWQTLRRWVRWSRRMW